MLLNFLVAHQGGKNGGGERAGLGGIEMGRVEGNFRKVVDVVKRMEGQRLNGGG